MKRHRKKFFVLLMSFCMMFTMMPTMAFAETDQENKDLIVDDAAVEEEAPVVQESEVTQEEVTEEPVQDEVKPETEQVEEEPVEEVEPVEEATPEETEEAEEVEPFDPTREDYLAYDPLYVSHYANPKYVNADDVSLDRYIDVVTAAKGVATYNVSKQKDFEFEKDNYLASLNYEMPVYNIDDDSDYYIAIPNVNKFNNEFKAYDLVVAYNNDMAELISGWKYEKGILYIPKSAVDNPKNDYETPEGALLAVQLNYAIGGDMEFTKRIPVQVLKKDEPVEKSVQTANLFDLEELTVSTGVKQRDSEDISVFLNGQMIPINDNAWVYDKSSGKIQIFVTPGVVSNVNIVFENQKMVEDLKDAAVSAVESIAVDAYAVTLSNMTAFKNSSNKDVVVTVPSWMYPGWRGVYQAKTYWGGAGRGGLGEAGRKKLKGWKASIKYLYGGTSAIPGSGEGWLDDGASGKRKYESNFEPLWSIASYACGADLGRLTNDGVLTRDMQVTHYTGTGVDDTETMTIYEWMMKNRNKLQKSKYVTKNSGSGSGNGIGGANNFALTFPKAGSVVSGCTNPAETHGNLVSKTTADGYDEGSEDFTFDVTGLGTGDYWYAASCNELVDAAASEGTAGDINGGDKAPTYMTCLGIDEDAGYVVFAFTQVRSTKQDATAIYKFKIKSIEEPGVPKYGWDKTAGFYKVLWGNTNPLPYQLTCEETKNDVEAGTTSFVDDMDDGILQLVPGSVNYTVTNGSEYFDGLTWTKDDATGAYTFNVKTKAIPESATAVNDSYVTVRIDYKVTVDWSKAPKEKNAIQNNWTLEPIFSGFDITKTVNSSANTTDTFNFTVHIETPSEFDEDDAEDNRPSYKIDNGTAVPLTYNDDLELNFTVSLKDKQTAHIQNIPVGSIYTVTEAASGYISSYTITANGSNPTIVKASNANTTTNTALATEEETLEGPDGTATVKFINNKLSATVHKVNASTNAELAGAQLQILQGSTVVVPTWTTTTTPKVVEGLDPGTYTLREIKAPYGYEIAPDQTFEVKVGQENTVTMKNTPVTVKTTAVDSSTGKHVGSRKTSSKITDTVHMTGLVKDRKYRLTGVLMNKRTGQAVPNVSVSPKEFTATAATMDVTMDFTFDSTALADGDSVVVYETLYRTSPVHGEAVPVELQKHQDINDKDQTIIYPTLSTNAVDPVSTTQNLLAGPNATIRDTITYKGLIPNETYILEGELYDKTAGKLIGVTAKNESFKPTTENGTTTMDFKFDATPYEGHTLVVYETLKSGTTVLVDHKNPNDAAQSIYLPRVRTTAKDTSTKDHLSNADTIVTVNDEVRCENLIVGKTYTISGKLVFKDTGADVKDNGQTVTAQTEPFTATATTMTKTLTFKFNGSVLEGKTIVAFETLTVIGKTVGTHADLTDEEQADHFPKVRTTAVDSETQDHIALGDESITIHDTVAYENLIPNKTYTVTGRLMDKTTGQEISGVTTQPVEFTPKTANGTVVIDFMFNGKNWQNHKTVVFEKLYLGTKAQVKDDNLIATHEDINDTDQTVRIPEGKTTATDNATKDHIAYAGKNVTITDILEYKNLIPGKEYSVTGTLMDKETGQPIKVNGENVTKTVPFTAKNENGSQAIDFVFDGSVLKGKTTVAFETVNYKYKPIIIHADINDQAQTVHFPKIGTKAALIDDFHKVQDTVTYENILPNKDYVVRGWLVDTATGAKVPKSDGFKKFSSGSNTAGTVVMEMNTAKYDDMKGFRMTAYEELYIIEKIDGKDTEVLVADHKDRNDENQTVEIYHDLKMKKNVTGNLGDLTKIFEYTAVFTDLEPSKTYTIEGDDAKTFKADAEGKATVNLKLADDQNLTIKQLPKSATYRITEVASDHVHEYKIFSEDMAKKGAKIVKLEDTNNTDPAKALATALETVDLFDGTVVIVWQNNRDLATLTGVPAYTGIWATALALVLAGATVLLIRRRKYSSEK